jgi:hypothetical protein
MSLFHYLHLGHLNQQALRQHKLVIERPLDMELVGNLFHEFGGTVTSEGKAMLDGEEFYTEPAGDCLVCQIPPGYSKAVEFIYQLAKQTGCDIATVEGGGSSSPEEFIEARRKPVPAAQPAAKSASVH